MEPVDKTGTGRGGDAENKASNTDQDRGGLDREDMASKVAAQTPAGPR